MSNNKKPVAIAVGAALAGGLALSGSAFAMHSLAQGYMLSGQEATSAAQEKSASMAKEEAEHADHAKADHAKMKGHEGSCGMDKMDSDKDGKISKPEFAAAHDGSDAKFAAHDPDGDGFISAAEMEAHHAADGKKKAGMEGKCGEGKCGEGKCGGSI